LKLDILKHAYHRHTLKCDLN